MNRLLFPRIAIILIFLVLVGRLYQLQLVNVDANRVSYSHDEITTRYVDVRPLRGEVFASDGQTLLAESVPIFNVSIRPAELDKAAPAGSARRTEIFTQLSQLLGVTSTLTISPVQVLDNTPALRSDLSQGLGTNFMSTSVTSSEPLPLEIAITPGRSTGAAELIRRYSPIVQLRTAAATSQLSEEAQKAVDVALAGLGGALEITGTLTISPATSLQDNAALRQDVARLLGSSAIAEAGPPREVNWLNLSISPQQALTGFQISQVYSDVVTLNNPLETKVSQADIPGYQTIILEEDVPREVALVLRENSTNLPGVVVEQDYRRRYPLSAETPTLSHILGYIGKINPCELISENSARSWSTALMASIGSAVQCQQIIPKPIDARQLGLPLYLNDDRIGKLGVEASYEAELRGTLGREALTVDYLGRPVGAARTTQAAQNGNNLQLTIDIAFQRQVEQILRNWIQEGENRRLNVSGKDAWKKDNYQPIRSGVAIVTEINTGRILAMASWPSYDDNIWVDPSRSAELQDLLAPSDPEKQAEIAALTPLLNRAISGLYPPGSTLKQFDAAIALQDGVITKDTKIRDPGQIQVADEFVEGRTYPFKNSISQDNGFITVSDALKVSSNIFFMTVAGGNKRIVNIKEQEKNLPDGLKVDRLAEGLEWFGLGELTGIKLAGEMSGLVPTPAWKQRVQREPWTIGDTYNMAIGQGNLLVTPLQLVTAATAVANNGTIYTPQIVKAILDPNGNVVREVEPEVLHKVDVSTENFATIREGMRRSVTEGANKAARDECSGLQIAGKTGTAEFGPNIIVKNASGQETVERQTHSWFVGFAPYDNPQIEVVVLSEGSGSLSDGSATIAVPAVTQIMQAYFQITPPNPLPTSCQQNMPALPQRASSDTAVPLDQHERHP